MPTFYGRALRLLARRGLRPGVGETAREFAARVDGPAAFVRLTALYERVRFGGRALSAADAEIVQTCLKEMTHGGS
jgi:hypothetical protein